MKKFYLTVSLFSVIALTGCQDNKKQTMENESVKVKIMQVTASQDMHCKRFSGTEWDSAQFFCHGNSEDGPCHLRAACL